LATKSDRVGNLLVMLPATPGLEAKPGIVIQGHVDMVCEQDAGTGHDFQKDPIRLVAEGEWLRADRTTLGADNGIAVAMMLALMKGDRPHGPVDLLFTVDEEIGLVGAMALDSAMLRYGTLLNIDGEEEGTFYIGCAGGKETEGHLPIDREPVPEGMAGLRITLGGLRGGHSGADIHLQPLNALKSLGRVLWEEAERHVFRLVDFRGGDKHNAIPREAFALLVAESADLASLIAGLKAREADLKDEIGADEPSLFLKLESVPAVSGAMLSADSQLRLLRLLMTMPHGVHLMSRTMKGLVSTSTNLAKVETGADQAFVLTSQRSDIQSLLESMAQQVRASIEAVGGRHVFVREYPAWTPRPDSPVLRAAVGCFEALFPDRPVKVGSIHAGLEPGVIGSKQPGMDMVSFGPDIQLAHTPKERVHIASTGRIWQFLLDLLVQ
jgi:dipeptidase D